MKAAASPPVKSDDPELDQLVEELANLHKDPLAFTYFAFPWGEEGTELEHCMGPEPWQAEFLKGLRDYSPQKALLEATSSGHGVGKGHANSLVIDTPFGTRRWGDLKRGDLVFGGDGRPTPIVGCRPYAARPHYRVAFDDGSWTEVSGEHLWNVRGRQERRNGWTGWRTLETRELLAQGAKRPNGIALARQWEIPQQGPAEFAAQDIPLHPYFVGVWLGDGSKGQPQFSKPYDEVAVKIECEAGYCVNRRSDGTTRYVPDARPLMGHPVFQCGSHERYIPDEYKHNTVERRRALFEGLCDTDGEVHAHTGTIGYSTTSERLAADMLWLARSLGCKAHLQPAIKNGRYWDGDTPVECRDCYRLTINAPFNPFTVEHKRDHFKLSEHRYLTRWIDSIELIDDAVGQCITVAAADGLYQTNDFIVTHNSSLVAWIIIWAISTCRDTRGVVTANTETQLKTKTWPELAKWFRLFIGRNLFRLEASGIFSREPEHERTWRIDVVPWSERNTEAFAGLHNQGRRILVIFDEASAIPDAIWETTQGALTDANTEIIWCVFGNPTRNDGRFKQCFPGGQFAHRWRTRTVDSREVSFTDKAQIKRWIDDYGDDDDFVRVRVKGTFPRIGNLQFIDSAVAAEAGKRETETFNHDPLVVGVDVARFGDDASVFYTRRGRDGRTIAPQVFRGLDTMGLAARLAEHVMAHRPDAVFIDGGGVGGGVIDRCRQLGVMVFEVQFGGRPDRPDVSAEQNRYANKRAEIWGMMREWLRVGAIPNDQQLIAELTLSQYGFNSRDEIQLESKTDLRRRGAGSPDMADALALTFSWPVLPRDFAGGERPKAVMAETEYDPFAEERAA